MSMYSEVLELQQEIVKLRSRNKYLFSLFRRLKTLARVRVHGIPTVSLIKGIIFIGLEIVMDSLLIAALNLILNVEILDYKIHQNKTRVQLSIRHFVCQTQLGILHAYDKIRRLL